MKKALLPFLTAALLFTACNNDKQVTHTEKHEDGSVTTTSYDLKNLEEGADEMTQRIEKLKALTPLSLDQLKSLLPEEVNGIKRTNFSANSAMGFAVAEAEYQKDDSTEIKLVIYDCAGEAGSGIFGMTYWTKMNMQQESSDGYTKTVDFQGDKAVETYQKDSNESTLTYVADDRLLVVVSGRNIDAGTLKQIAKDLKMKA